MMMTGLHRVRDIYCLSCYCCLGWKYVSVLIRNVELHASQALKNFNLSLTLGKGIRNVSEI